ncbi:MAG: helix-turn-helix domain-containing protein [Halobacteriales archaeon]|nr:helix-turn-helix domain-containing protein [Halobacteriales archaeon]
MVVSRDLNVRLYDIVEELVRQGLTLEQARKEFEKQFIVSTLRENSGNLSRSARHLGVHRNTLRNKVSNLGIETDEYSARGRRRSQRDH